LGFQNFAMQLFFILLLLLILPNWTQAEQPSIALLAPTDVTWFTPDQLEDPFGFLPKPIDTTIIGFQRYDFSFRNNPFFAHRGNVGHAVRWLEFRPYSGIRFTPHATSAFGGVHFTPDSIRLYELRHVFSELYYVTGADNEQLFFANHNQKFSERFFGGFKYQAVSSPGSFNHIASNHTNVKFTIHYRLPGDRYQVLGSFISNRNRLQESGGLENRLDFEANPNMDIVRMPSATSQTRETIVNLRQFYQTGFYLNQANEDAQQRFLNLGRLTHEFSWISQALVFNDPASPISFFATPPANTNFTFDSTRISILENRIGWSNFPLQTARGRFPFNLKLFLKHSFIDIQQPLSADATRKITWDRRRYNQVVQGAEIETDQSLFLSGKAFANLTLGGYHDGDVSLGATVAMGRPEQRYRLQFIADLHNRQAPYFLSRFSSNYVRWDNNFAKQTIARAGVVLQSDWISAGINYFVLNNMVFLGPQGLPIQNTNTLGLLQANLTVQSRLGPLRTINRILFQRVSDTPFENFPELVSYHSVFFAFPLFNRAMHLNVGMDVHFNTAYQPMGYLPMVRQFYAQDHFMASETILANAFATFDVQRTRFFLKAQNLGALLPNAPIVYHIPFYPLPGMAIKFGVSWMFFN